MRRRTRGERPSAERTFPGAADGGALIEFEVKAPVPPERLDALRRALGPPRAVEEHADAYYQHPARDLARTDEALRLSMRGGRADLTYKGPKLDATTKSRVEIVVPLTGGEDAARLLDALGFRRVRVVRKVRSTFEAAGFEVALDEVPGLGVFVELERRLPEDSPRADAEREARALLASWGLERTERRSYLELLEHG